MKGGYVVRSKTTGLYWVDHTKNRWSTRSRDKNWSRDIDQARIFTTSGAARNSRGYDMWYKMERQGPPTPYQVPWSNKVQYRNLYPVMQRHTPHSSNTEVVRVEYSLIEKEVVGS